MNGEFPFASHLPGQLCRSAERSTLQLTAHCWLEPVCKLWSFTLTHLHPLPVSLQVSAFASNPDYVDGYPTASYCGQDLQKADLIMSQGQVHMPGEGGTHTICLLSLCCEPACTISTSCPLPSGQQIAKALLARYTPSPAVWLSCLGQPSSRAPKMGERGSRGLNSLHWIPEMITVARDGRDHPFANRTRL